MTDLKHTPLRDTVAQEYRRVRKLLTMTEHEPILNSECTCRFCEMLQAQARMVVPAYIVIGAIVSCGIIATVAWVLAK